MNIPLYMLEAIIILAINSAKENMRRASQNKMNMVETLAHVCYTVFRQNLRWTVMVRMGWSVMEEYI